MQLDIDDNRGPWRIRGYDLGRIQVNERVFTRSLILTERALIEAWAPQRLEELTADHLAEVVALEPEIILLGTGERLRFPPAEVLAPLSGSGIGLEVMDTPAACRTYNILAGEGRRVAAALMMIEG